MPRSRSARKSPIPSTMIGYTRRACSSTSRLSGRAAAKGWENTVATAALARVCAPGKNHAD